MRVPRSVASGLFCLAAFFSASDVPAEGLDPAALAEAAVIHRDEWGVPHVDGPTDVSVVFGFAYAQAEDYFWQIEDSYLQCLGLYAEVVGERGLEADLLSRNFEIATRSKADFPKLPPEDRAICEAFTLGLNHFLEKRPDVKPRRIDRFEPWHVLAFARYTMLDWTFGRSHASKGEQAKFLQASAEIGSNAWAIGPSRTKRKTAMLFINPHQPWFGTGQFYEGHLRSREGWNFSGSTFFGGPFPTMGHNEHLGWAHTANNPDIADVYRVTFDHPDDPLAYRSGDGWRKARQWTETIRVKSTAGTEERKYTFRKTHLGPIVGKESDTVYRAVQIARLFDGNRIRQGRNMAKARNFGEWKAALAELNLQMFNVVYADREGNIFYCYHGAVPRRERGLDWTRPVDGGDPRTEWKGIHPLDELPQTLNPRSGFVQNCNATPFLCTDDGNPAEGDYPRYMVEDRHDNRRSKVSRMLLRGMKDVTMADWKRYCFDTTLYWPVVELPALARDLERVGQGDASLAERVRPYLSHLLDWDGKSSIDSTQATLCAAWYEEMYGSSYPAETLKAEMVEPARRLEALATAAGKLERLYGSWKVRWGDVYRMQRIPNIGDYKLVPFKEDRESIPNPGAPGPLGIVFNTYYTPATPERKLRFGVVGGSFIGAIEFGPKVEAWTVLQFGQSSDPVSPHFFDQARLYSKREFKPAWFHWDDVVAHTRRKYHPGGENL